MHILFSVFSKSERLFNTGSQKRAECITQQIAPQKSEPENKSADSGCADRIQKRRVQQLRTFHKIRHEKRRRQIELYALTEQKSKSAIHCHCPSGVRKIGVEKVRRNGEPPADSDPTNAQKAKRCEIQQPWFQISLHFTVRLRDRKSDVPSFPSRDTGR